ncbi:probable caffeoyl-CoA O-methyltransferase 2 [Ixodes scapularis]|uniref:probable caffeoyl-CoA O-methyltransferase 2 n=1 Tax=Ixodes scapularis TaxID=6945 RepID=UPI001A9EDFD9|nr:probable caffeoyl-CoA O-methyltransferase 2 [Ixodes scapularis]
MMSTRSVLHLLHTLIKATGAKRFLDIGVFTGCSSLAAALALPEDGHVVGLDISMEFPEIGMPFWKKAAVDHKIDVRVAPASESLDLMIKNGETFDIIFIDADKPGCSGYFKKSLKVLKKNGIVAVDNVLFHGQVLDLDNNEPVPASMRIVNDIIYKDDAVFASMLTVGDGLTLALKK